MKVLVCGGRNYTDSTFLFVTLDLFTAEHRIDSVIHGGAKGADRLAGEWADARGKPCKMFVADWVKYGRSAGVRRNQQMLDEGKPDVVIAFPGGRGTADMIRRATEAGIRIVQVGGDGGEGTPAHR